MLHFFQSICDGLRPNRAVLLKQQPNEAGSNEAGVLRTAGSCYRSFSSHHNCYLISFHALAILTFFRRSTEFSSQRLSEYIMLILLPAHRTNVDLAALQQSTLYTTSLSLLLIVHRVNVLPSECTKASIKIQVLYLPPNHQDLIWMQGDAIRD